MSSKSSQADPSAASAEDAGPFVPVGTLPDATAAQVLLEALTQEQIPVKTRSVPPTNFLGPFSMVSMDAVEVLVPAERLSEAQQIHAALCAPEGPDAPPEGMDGESPGLAQRRRTRLVFLLMALLLVVVLIWLRSA